MHVGVVNIFGYLRTRHFRASFSLVSSLSLAVFSCLNDPVKILSTFAGFLSMHSSIAEISSAGRTAHKNQVPFKHQTKENTLYIYCTFNEL